ncbi:flavin reductase family protein [Marinitenerispora sediminis]|uniref:Flavin reductase n=1 Tax=Marinitenerispora sediminis TaxID=1931232 RepID=A0A368SZ53_9ACTN|nr:flavin reductase family protein [Marinitenerispora sediminis]RCV47873.1 flavin reductase [Marinitenerispora sediminis]RCV48727.1 flavin reductase [Marinitenerispora sediminis]RCV50485.1 flavin reductase [Marinitenerispora sediminis]
MDSTNATVGDTARTRAAGGPAPEAERPPTEPGVDTELFRQALGRHPAGVVVVTADLAGEPVGVTATSFTSVSLSPPLVGFYITQSSSTWPKLRAAGGFAVNLLAEDQDGLAARFARTGVDRFAAPTSWTRAPDATPLLAGAAAHLLCERHDLRLFGDHWLVVGRVTRTVLPAARPPLVYHQRMFGGFRPNA